MGVVCHLVLSKQWQFSEAFRGCDESSDIGRASLREDYLNQVQRDFLSLGFD
jgi:hypothetical protein